VGNTLGWIEKHLGVRGSPPRAWGIHFQDAIV
jgi:hypothetical protein